MQSRVGTGAKYPTPHQAKTWDQVSLSNVVKDFLRADGADMGSMVGDGCGLWFVDCGVWGVGWGFKTVPAVRKDACTLLSLQANKPKNLLMEHVWRAWGAWGDAEKSYASMSVKFELFGREKSQENHRNMFRVFSTSNSSPILLFCPQKPKFDFLGKYKKTRGGK